MSTMDLLAKVRSLKELEALISEAQAELDGIKDELKAEMTNRNTEELDVDVFKIRYKTVKSKRESAMEIALKMIKESTLSVEKITEITSLTVDEVKALAEKKVV